MTSHNVNTNKPCLLTETKDCVLFINYLPRAFLVSTELVLLIDLKPVPAGAFNTADKGCDGRGEDNPRLAPNNSLKQAQVLKG